MLVAIDTSVLVAAIIAAHASHAPAKLWLDAIYRGELDAIVCTHALAELYAVLTPKHTWLPSIGAAREG